MCAIHVFYTHTAHTMRTDIDDDLMYTAMRAGPYSIEREAVEAGLQGFARKAAYRDILALRGQLQWNDGSLPKGATAVAVLVAHNPSTPSSANSASVRPKAAAKRA